MTRDYKLNKSELIRLKREEKLYEHYLPVLKLKLEQLQREQNRLRKTLEHLEIEKQKESLKLAPYISFFSDCQNVSLENVVVANEIKTTTKYIAGVALKVFQSVSFKDVDIPYFQTAPWLIRSLPLVKSYVERECQRLLLDEENRIIKREIQRALQKVNLFDKVLIPKTKNAIRHIKISLGDEETADVVRGKIAKAKMAKTEAAFFAPTEMEMP